MINIRDLLNFLLFFILIKMDGCAKKRDIYTFFITVQHTTLIGGLSFDWKKSWETKVYLDRRIFLTLKDNKIYILFLQLDFFQTTFCASITSHQKNVSII